MASDFIYACVREGQPKVSPAGSSLLMAKFVARNRLALQLLAVCFSGR